LQHLFAKPGSVGDTTGLRHAQRFGERIAVHPNVRCASRGVATSDRWLARGTRP
jgi:hypothetical protein